MFAISVREREKVWGVSLPDGFLRGCEGSA